VPGQVTTETEKQRVRAAMLRARRSAPVAARTAADAALVHALLAAVRAEPRHTVAAYSPLPSEPGGADLPAVLTAAGLTVLLPVLLPDRDLDWVQFPSSTPLGLDAIGAADLVVVPAVAVDATGVRLGRGGGSYDRALRRVRPSTLVVALLYGGELVPRLPAEPHDQRVHAVILPDDGLVYLPTFAGRSPAS
jgi:5-formyltetrahydrofolate cyclo-ligase